MPPVFARLRKGHRLRLTLSTSVSHLAPTAAQLPGLAGGVYDVHRGAARASFVNLPLAARRGCAPARATGAIATGSAERLESAPTRERSLRMAVAAAVFDETQRATLEALCETFVPVGGDRQRRPAGARVHGALGARHAGARADRGDARRGDDAGGDRRGGRAARRARRGGPGLAAGRGAHPDRARLPRPGPRGQARPRLAARADAAAVLRAARRRRAQPQLGGDRVSGADLCGALRRRPRRRRSARRGGERRLGRADRRRRGRRLGRRRLA